MRVQPNFQTRTKEEATTVDAKEVPCEFSAVDDLEAEEAALREKEGCEEVQSVRRDSNGPEQRPEQPQQTQVDADPDSPNATEKR